MRVNLIDLLRDRAAAQPDSTAFTFLESGENEGASLTWSALDLRSRAIAAAIQTKVRPGDRVLVMLPPGVDFVAAFFGVVYAGAVAIPVYPPSGGRADRTAARLRAIVDDARVSLVVSSTAVAGKRSVVASLIPRLAGLSWLTVDTVDDSAVEAWRLTACGGDSLALLQYTSGSTASPRGVMVTHANLLDNLTYSAALAKHDRSSVAVSWLPVNHDMGLIDGVLQPVFSGFCSYLMAPAAFLQRPARWLQAISRFGATHSGGPNFAYDLCARRVQDDERDALDLSTWRIAFNGSEPVRRSTLESFHRRFASSGFRWEAFRPAYGLAESTLLVTSTRADETPQFLDIEPGRSLVSCGTINGTPRIRIVDPATRAVVGDGAVGEIWVAGRSVAQGYWNQPHDSAATFQATIDGVDDGPYLRTGDLGCIVKDRLFVTGRMKDVLIVRGVKHYPQDLEATAERAHPAIRAGCCAAFSVDRHDEERIVVVAEVDPRRPLGDGDFERTSTAIRLAIGEAHQVDVADVTLVPAGTLPRTTSGKLQRYLCRDAFVSGSWDGPKGPHYTERSEPRQGCPTECSQPRQGRPTDCREPVKGRQALAS